MFPFVTVWNNAVGLVMYTVYNQPVALDIWYIPRNIRSLLLPVLLIDKRHIKHNTFLPTAAIVNHTCQR